MPMTSPGPALTRERPTWRSNAPMFTGVIVLHLISWGVLVFAVLPEQLQLGTQVFGVGLAVTAYTLGMRHAFDPDHIAAIDNTTRKLLAEGRRPQSVGFWFALGHSSVVVLLALLIAAGARAAGVLLDDSSATHQTLGVLGTSLSGLFLLVIGLVNLAALVAIVRVFVKMRRGHYDAAALDAALDSRGFITRILGRLTRSLNRPWQMYGVGVLFGLGFDTASEVALLVLAGTGAAAGLPWYAVLVLPLLFAAGMTLFDTLDGAFMHVAYDWAFANPIRKIYYNLTLTGLSVAVALLIGMIELISVLHDKLDLTDAVSTWIANLQLDNVGFIIVGLFVVVWVAAVGYWRLAKVEQRWALPNA